MSQLSEIFSKPPLSLTKEDLDTIIAEQRKQRAQYSLNGKGQPAVGKEKKPREKAPTLDKSVLDNLDI